MNILDFLKQPDVTIIQALLLKFRPVNMDVLPMYIVLMVMFPPMLWLLRRSPTLALAVSAGIYAIVWKFNINLPAYPEGTWVFNPFAWQLLFVFGAWCALGGAERLSMLLNSRVTLTIAIIYLLVAFYVALSWQLPMLHPLVPTALEDVIYPIDKTNLDVLRFAHFLALAVVVVWFIPRTWPPLTSRAFYPAILCGQHSLEIFCLGVFLSFAGHFALVEISGAIWMQIVISIVGVVAMVAAAALIAWYKRADERRPGPRQKPANADFAGGEA
jgi:hypothetical protein